MREAIKTEEEQTPRGLWEQHGNWSVSAAWAEVDDGCVVLMACFHACALWEWIG